MFDCGSWLVVAVMKRSQIVLCLVLLPLVLVFLSVYVLLWIMPGFGWCYERRAVREHHRRYFPRGPDHSFIPLQAMNGKKVHVKQRTITPPQLTTITTTSHPPPVIVVFFPGAANTIAALEFIMRDAISELQSTDGGELDRPIRLIQFEHVGYGYSDPIESGEEVDLSGASICRATHELLCLLLTSSSPTTSSQSATHPPIIAWGGSYGGQLAQLYRFLYPNSVSALLLIDPSPTTIFNADDAPMGSQMNKAANLYRMTATMANVGFIRPLGVLMRFSSGEVKEAMDIMPPEYVGQVFTASHLYQMAREFDGFKATCQQLDAQYNRHPHPMSVPLVLVSACRFSELYGGRTAEETSDWWEASQQPYLRSSTVAVYERQDRTHVQVGTDGKMQGQYLKQLIPKISEMRSFEGLGSNLPVHHSAF